ncbi:MAG: hypothetical protein ACAH83_08730 [Alphaproteobacteria bacterium]
MNADDPIEHTLSILTGAFMGAVGGKVVTGLTACFGAAAGIAAAAVGIAIVGFMAVSEHQYSKDLIEDRGDGPAPNAAKTFFGAFLAAGALMLAFAGPATHGTGAGHEKRAEVTSQHATYRYKGSPRLLPPAARDRGKWRPAALTVQPG